MGERLDQMKGTIKEKAGRMRDDPELEQEGKRDRARSDLKRGVDDAAEKVKRAVDMIGR